jgi:tripartite-type tricarboxylate transporter receptor subunit TctC
MTSSRIQRRQFVTTLAAMAASSAAAPALANTWPSQNLKIIVPFAPGGTSDFIARIIAKPLGDALKATVTVENRTGGNGNVGAAAVALATDQHSMLLADMGSLAIAHLFAKDLTYKLEDLQGATMLAYSPHLLAVHPSVPANNLKDLVALSQSKRINVASAGNGTINHLGVVEIALATGMKWQHVPYRGGAQALQDTVSGTTQMLLNGMVATQPHVAAGRLKVIGISKKTRMALAANVPTLAEQGMSGFESGTYQGVTVPASMPKANVAALSAALIQVIRSPEVRERMVSAGAEVMTSTPAELSQFIAAERKRWSAVMQRAGTQLEGTA